MSSKSHVKKEKEKKKKDKRIYEKNNEKGWKISVSCFLMIYLQCP